MRACEWSDRLDKLWGHLEECVLLCVPCPLGCISLQQEGEDGMCRVTRVQRGEMETHKREVCPKRFVGCEFCVRRVRACEVNAHLEECEEFVILCPNMCDGTGELTQLKRKELVYHLGEVCPFHKVECYNCATGVERRYLEDHEANLCPMRKLKCKFCFRVVEAFDMSTHLEVCNEILIPCPNYCPEVQGNKLKRKNLSSHLSQKCSLEKVSCPYSEVGCGKKLKRTSVENHEKEFSHIHIKLTNQHFIKIQKEQTANIELLKRENQKLRASLDSVVSAHNPPCRGGIEWNIYHIGKILQNEESVYSNPFYVGFYKMQASFDFEDRKLGCFIHILSGQWDEDLTWPLRYRYCIVLHKSENGKENFIQSHKISENDMLKHIECFQRPNKYQSVGFGLSNFISYSQFLDGKFISNDSVKMEITIETVDTKSRIFNLFQSDIPGLRNSIVKLDKHFASLKLGQLIWEIHKVNKTVEKGEFILTSPIFYAGFYKCQCQVEFNYRVSRYIACYIYLLKGKWDEALAWPIKGKLTFTLVNRENREKNLSFVILRDDSNGENFGNNPSNETSGFGIPGFIPKYDLLDPKYCLGDSIVLEIKFEVFS